jgi:hypothetical protein
VLISECRRANASRPMSFQSAIRIQHSAFSG